MVAKWEDTGKVLLTTEVGILKGKVEQLVKDKAYLDDVTLTIRTN